VGEADLAVAPFTTDGDLVIEPGVLGRAPPIEKVLSNAGFRPQSRDSVGIWISHRPISKGQVPVAVDLLVPVSVSPGKGRRAAKLQGHDPKAARIVEGLEGALIDFDRMALGALEVSDERKHDIRVAGPAALLVSKLHKIADRQSGERLHDKDALDAFRLLRGTSSDEMADRVKVLLGQPLSRVPTERAIELLADLFGDRSYNGVKMIVRATAGLADGDELSLSFEILSRELLNAIGK
jgi:hypothetical protein